MQATSKSSASLLVAGEIRLFSPVAYICNDDPANSNHQSSGELNWTFTLTNSSFLISPTHNVFMAIGCGTLAFVDGREDESFFTGCITTCKSLHDAAQDGDECTGLGCCQTGIPGNLSTISIYWSVDKNDSLTNPTWSPCSYAFVSEKGWYKFKRRDLTRVGNKSFTDRVGDRTIPMVLDWALRNDGSCQPPAEDGKSSAKPTPSACASANSYCVNATQRHGYLCHCSKGYEGNPGNGKSDKGCQPIVPGYGVAIVATFVAVVLACLAIVLLQRREHRKRFSKNGGDILKDVGIVIFNEGELKKITNGYKKNIGEGSFGKVYQGTINGTQVAVKCSNSKGEALPLEEFRNEIIFQFRINHENVVRLVGCCLETTVPMLVFEFVPNGSLFDRLHVNRHQVLPLLSRLDIAIGSAEALAYMHSHGGHNQNHVHGDVKSVKTDRNYLDPVYMKTDRFTTKSDVYSFGVVLLELITRKTPKYDGNNSLSIDFVQTCKVEGNGRKMYDTDILMNDGNAQSSQVYIECLDKIGELAVRCLKEVDVDERPTMERWWRSLRKSS
ncbi:hypothetical protein QOZ80_9BG0718700 [Eleusine coracana subsp. coracana]|nr:hypothetical protein QOZ80_9BG0718700 [Eleusine coracana subsp. coracana]